MPRTTPTKQLNVIGSFDYSPKNVIPDYFVAKEDLKVTSKSINYDTIENSIELLYIRNHREYDAMLKEQRQEIENGAHQMKQNADRINEMYKIQENLRKRLIEINSFLKDCSEKRRKAEIAAASEVERHKELTISIDELKNSINKLNNFRKELNGTVSQFQPYERVLEEVVQKSDIYQDPKDCIDRCNALMLAQVEINKFGTLKIADIELMRKRMVALTNEAALRVLGLKNDLSRLERMYNESRMTCLKWERYFGCAKTKVEEFNLEKQRTMDVLYHIYRLLGRRNYQSKIPFSRNKVEKIVNFIFNEITLFNQVFEELETEKSENSNVKMKLKANAYC